MTTSSSDDGASPTEHLARMQANLVRLEELTGRLVAALSQSREVPAPLQGPNPDLYAKAAGAWWAGAMTNPAKLYEQQIAYWGESLKTFAEAQQAMTGHAAAPHKPQEPHEPPKDRRFAHPLWQSNPYFSFVRQQYELNVRTIEAALAEARGLDPQDRQRLEYFTRQIIDMMSPTNFLATNPEALSLAAETQGESLIRGLENLVRDLEANDGDLVVTLADRDAFRVGENLATTPGQVVFRNRLFELIQYAPATDEVHEIPLLILPPWINKYYILDLTPRNSLIRWLTEQGHTVFVASWVNPDPSYRDTGLADYVEDGFLAAMREVRSICGTDRLNAVGYCIGGTTLALALALMNRRGDDGVESATFFTTLTDFSQQGEVGMFLDNDFVDGLEAEANRTGVLDRFYMARTFSFLRSNDLIYRPAIRSYMMGEAPPAFDLLFWNGDGTNLPAKMAVDYLRGLCQDDLFATEGFPLAGERVRLSDVTVPLCAVACETDHIADWKSSYRGIRKMGAADKTFILSESGHIAGIVNPPSKGKYGHYAGRDLAPSPEDWRAAAVRQDGSWWPRWRDWLAARSGGRVPARQPGTGGRAPLAAAPGTYVVAQPPRSGRAPFGMSDPA